MQMRRGNGPLCTVTGSRSACFKKKKEKINVELKRGHCVFVIIFWLNHYYSCLSIWVEKKEMKKTKLKIECASERVTPAFSNAADGDGI